MPAATTRSACPEAAKLLGLEPRTVRELITRGELHAEVTYADWTSLRRSFHLTRRDVDDFLERARVKPGDLPAAPTPLLDVGEVRLRAAR